MASKTSTSISVQIASGTYQFKVENSKTKDIGIGKFVSTPKFSAGGHNWLIKYYPQGYVAENEGNYISLCLMLLNISRSVKVDYELGILNKYGRPTAESWARSTDIFNAKMSWMYANFMKRSDLESRYIRDDCFIVVCSVTVINEPCALLKSCSVGAFPFNLANELGILLERQEEVDVIFKVEGEDISAHRLILACRSPVFKAELFGQMVERNSKFIKIDDMIPLVFRAMLHFMYTDSVPDIEDLVSEGTSDMNMSSTILYQHLIVAADRYMLKGLKKLCEERLCRTIFIDTVVSSLAVAEQHNCDDLKKECLEFIADPNNLLRVVLSKEYISLASSCPLLLDRLREKVITQ
jgi:speckle-type POZ protein